MSTPVWSDTLVAWSYAPAGVTPAQWEAELKERQDRQHAQVCADVRQRLAADIREFRGCFPLVDLDGMPARHLVTPGEKCVACQGVDWSHGRHNDPACWIWRPAFLYTEQRGLCGLCAGPDQVRRKPTLS